VRQEILREALKYLSKGDQSINLKKDWNRALKNHFVNKKDLDSDK